MSKTRKGSKMTKKLLGRGKNKRKTAKRGKVQCGGISYFPGRAPVHKETRDKYSSGLKSGLNVLKNQGRIVKRRLGSRGTNVRDGLKRTRRKMKRSFSKEGRDRRKGIRNANEKHKGNMSQIQSKYDEKISSNQKALTQLEDQKTNDLLVINNEIEHFNALINENKEDIESFKNFITDLETDLEKKKNTNDDVEETKKAIQETSEEIEKLEKKNLEYNEKKTEKETEREKILQEYNEKKKAKETSVERAKKVYQHQKVTSEARQKGKYLKDLAEEKIAPKFLSKIQEELDKIEGVHKKIQNILENEIKDYDNIVDLVDFIEREAFVERVKEYLKHDTKEKYETLYNIFIRYLDGRTLEGTGEQANTMNTNQTLNRQAVSPIAEATQQSETNLASVVNISNGQDLKFSTEDPSPSFFKNFDNIFGRSSSTPSAEPVKAQEAQPIKAQPAQPDVLFWGQSDSRGAKITPITTGDPVPPYNNTMKTGDARVG